MSILLRPSPSRRPGPSCEKSFKIVPDTTRPWNYALYLGQGLGPGPGH